MAQKIATNKLKKPKDLPKAPITRVTASDMFNPTLGKPLPITPSIVPRSTTGTPGGTIPPGMVTPTTAGPAVDLSGAGTVTDPSGTGAAGTGTLPGGYTDTAYLSGFLNDNPDVLSADVLAGMGITNMDMIGMLSDLVGAGPAMYLLTHGSTPEGFDSSPGAELGYQQSMAEGLMAPGGGSGLGGVDDLMGAIMSASPDSPLGAFLATGSPQDVRNLIEAAAMMGTGNPYYRNAIQNQLDREDLTLKQSMAHGAPMGDDAYYQQLRGGTFGRYF